MTQGEEDVHAFSWSADSNRIYFATRQPWSKTQKDDYKQEWKDVVQYRTAERGDTIFALDICGGSWAARRPRPRKSRKKKASPNSSPTSLPDAQPIATLPLRVDSLVTSPDGTKLAFLSNAINQRQEKYEDVELYVVDLQSRAPNASLAASPTTRPWKRIRTGLTTAATFSSTSKSETSPAPTATCNRIFTGSTPSPAQRPITSNNGAKISSAPSNTLPLPVTTLLPRRAWARKSNCIPSVSHRTRCTASTDWPGTYANISTAEHSSRVAFVYSSLGKPEEVYLADSADKLDQARPITSFNKLFAERDLPQGKPYQWKADDGTTVEGMLIYPPGKFEAKHLPMLTFIHGGPADADGNHFEADWYQWAALAATNGWLVFEPNYRGSTGYGDKFLMQIVPADRLAPRQRHSRRRRRAGKRRHRRSPITSPSAATAMADT